MAWVVLLIAGLLEAVWAVALSESRGFTKVGPSVLFLIALALSMGGLAFALRSLPVGTAYSVWVGIGAVSTAAYGVAVLGEPAGVARVVCLILIVAGVAGLRLLHG
jgi:quaternary ammonium compound-resistance protein SugE